MELRGLIFDLDGTLLDSLADIATAMNAALADHGLPTHPVAAYAGFVGEGVERLARNALPPGSEAIKPAVLDSYRAHYAERMLDATQPYPGIPDMLALLHGHGIRLAVLSNKPDAPVQKLVAVLLGGVPFVAVRGHRPDALRKPHPAVALALCAALGVDPSQCGFVGDSAIDMQTASAAGMVGIGVTWGFRGREELVAGGAAFLADTPGEVVRCTVP